MSKISKKYGELPGSVVITAVSMFILIFGNFTFFSNVINIYPLNSSNMLHLLSLALLLFLLNCFLLSLFCFKFTTKPVLITILMLSSIVAYYMDSYKIVIDDVMIDNIFRTNMDETIDLISFKLLLYVVFMGLVPSFFIYKVKMKKLKAKTAFLHRLVLTGGSITVALLTVFIFSSFYASFFREHKPLRYYANPAYYLYSSGQYAGRLFKGSTIPFKQIGLDAKIAPSDCDKELVIFVIGESVRADHMSLNGYKRKTNPLLEKEEVYSFTNVWSCATATADAVRCMLSATDRSHYSSGKAKATDNILDILKRAGVNVLWLDNNSSSQGMANRVPFINYRTPENNPDCQGECRDMGMLTALQDYVYSHPNGDIFIVLHQMGNHGPDYYKRYPPEFEKFTPTCKTNQLENCTIEEINNAYDNILLYTDYFLTETIKFLKENNQSFETVMFYISDHGESLGENHIYLHSMPYMIAPDEQKHVPMIMWFGDNYHNKEAVIDSLKEQLNRKLTQDIVFHTLLGFFEIETTLYKKELDILSYSIQISSTETAP